MLAKRVLAAGFMAAIGAPAILLGGIPYFAVIGIFVSLAAWEYAQMFRSIGHRPATALVVGGTWLLLGSRMFSPASASLILTISILLAMTWHLISYERGRASAATDFTVTVGGLVYFGWIGAYLMDLRSLSDGLWWFLLVMPSIWIADSAAYFIGKGFGKTPLAPRLSPRKTWEGYGAGMLAGALAGAGLGLLYQQVAGLAVTWWQGGMLGLILSLLTTLGDLGESMIKRQAGLKDSSNLIPGHGGFFDRIDGWLWGAVIGYYFIHWFLL